MFNVLPIVLVMCCHQSIKLLNCYVIILSKQISPVLLIDIWCWSCWHFGKFWKSKRIHINRKLYCEYHNLSEIWGTHGRVEPHHCGVISQVITHPHHRASTSHHNLLCYCSEVMTRGFCTSAWCDGLTWELASVHVPGALLLHWFVLDKPPTPENKWQVRCCTEI